MKFIINIKVTIHRHRYFLRIILNLIKLNNIIRVVPLMRVKIDILDHFVMKFINVLKKFVKNKEVIHYWRNPIIEFIIKFKNKCVKLLNFLRN